MSLLGKLFGGSAATGVIDSLANAGDRLFTSDEERLQWQTMMEKIKTQPIAMREMVNVITASSTSPFVAGGRSAIQYALAIIIGYNLCIRDMLILILDRHGVCQPAFGMEQLLGILKMFFGGM